jgi:hypothetical protein
MAHVRSDTRYPTDASRRRPRQRCLRFSASENPRGSPCHFEIIGVVTISLSDTQHQFASRCYHMRTDSLDVRLIATCNTVRKWEGKLHKAFWLHVDIARSKCKFTILAGAVKTDRDCLVPGPACRNGVRVMLNQIVRVELRAK